MHILVIKQALWLLVQAIYPGVVDLMCESTLKRMEVRILFVPSVKESLLFMAELLICVTTCKEAMLPDSEQP